MSVESNSSLFCFCFCFLFFFVLTKLAPLSQPTRSKTKTNASSTRVFSRAWRRLHVITSNSDWFTELSASVVIGQSNCLGFGFTTLNCSTVQLSHRQFAAFGGGRRTLSPQQHQTLCYNSLIHDIHYILHIEWSFFMTPIVIIIILSSNAGYKIWQPVRLMWTNKLLK